MATEMFNPGVSPKVSFTYYNYDKGVLFDEKKQRFLEFADMDYITYLRYKNSFKNVKF